MIAEDGTGLTDADSYVDPTSAYAVHYFTSHLYATSFTGATADEQAAACIMATRTMDSLMEWNGRRLTSTQALAWPRSGFCVDGVTVSGLPSAIKAATLELALALLIKNRTSDTGSGEAEVTSIGLGSGALSISLGTDPTVAPVKSGDMIPAYVRRLLRDYGFTIGGGMTRIERR